MGIRPENRDAGGVINHGLCQIGVGIKADADGQIISGNLADAAEQFAFTIIIFFGHHRTVQIKVNAIKLRGVGDAIRDDPCNFFIGMAGDMGAGFSGAPNDGDQFN